MFTLQNWPLFYSVLLVSCWPPTVVAGRTDGYTYGQPMPVTCLNRTIDSGEHITDNLGKLQYIPFPICNETFHPLALRYGVTETVNCTINSIPDELYHLLEYYVHSDVPMTCRVPTSPLSTDTTSVTTDSDNSNRKPAPGEEDTTNANTVSLLDENGPSYTPITFALQGTLQRSHLHIWTDMNVLAHSIAKPSTKKSKKGAVKPGYIVAGTAYSVPEFEFSFLKGIGSDPGQEASAIAEAARDPWTAGHGTKVIRGEPLTFTFHVSWVEGSRGIGWPSREKDASAESGVLGNLFSELFFFGIAACFGAFAALYWERSRRRRGGWKGDGILGMPNLGGAGGKMGGGLAAGVSFGNGGKANGYGGYSGGSGVGYGGFSSGKKD